MNAIAVAAAILLHTALYDKIEFARDKKHLFRCEWIEMKMVTEWEKKTKTAAAIVRWADIKIAFIVIECIWIAEAVLSS